MKKLFQRLFKDICESENDYENLSYTEYDDKYCKFEFNFYVLFIAGIIIGFIVFNIIIGIKMLLF